MPLSTIMSQILSITLFLTRKATSLPNRNQTWWFIMLLNSVNADITRYRNLTVCDVTEHLQGTVPCFYCSLVILTISFWEYTILCMYVIMYKCVKQLWHHITDEIILITILIFTNVVCQNSLGNLHMQCVNIYLEINFKKKSTNLLYIVKKSIHYVLVLVILCKFFQYFRINNNEKQNMGFGITQNLN